MNISFIGFGSMAKALARGLLSEPSYQIRAAAPSLSVGINKDNIHTHYNNKEVVRDAQIVLLAVKPAQMHDVIQEIAPLLPSSCLLISIASGLTLDWFSQRLPESRAVVRSMPNTPVAIGLGATPLIANEYCSVQQKHWAESIFSHIGIMRWLAQEEDLDAFTALSGSGPAYVFLFVEALMNAAIDLGLDANAAKEFALQTCHGALALARSSELTFAELRTQVTSPGGTTAAALNVLSPTLEELMLHALHAAKNQATELGQLFK